MIGKLRSVLMLTALGAIVGSAFPGGLDAQATSRFRVLIPNLEPLENADDGFGEDVAKELRKLINELATHEPVEEKEIKDAAKKFKMDMDDLNCIRSRQLATQINAQLVMCGSYTEDESAKTFSLQNLQFVSPDGEAFNIDAFVAQEKGQKEAAQAIFDAFNGYIEQLRFAAFCGDYFQSSQWDSSIENCRRTLDINPLANSARYIMARALMEKGDNEQAYQEVLTVVENDPLNEDALQTAGYLAATMGNEDAARTYYNRYLELNPANAAVRMRVAYDLAQAGDPEGGMILIEEGLALDPENVDLLVQHGNFAFAAGRKALDEAGAPAEGESLPPQVVNLYRKALGSYDKVYAAKGADMDVNQLRNMVAGHLELGELEQAIAMAERSLQTHQNEAQLWSIYGDVLQRSGRLADAITALERVTQVDAEYPNVAVRKGKWMLDSGDVEGALPVLQEAVRRGEQPADVVANMLFGNAYQRGVQPKNWGHAIRVIGLAKQFEVGSNTQAQLDFWHAYSLYSQAVQEQEPQTLATAQSTLPKFQQALRLFQSAREYASSQPSINLQQFLDASNTYIEIQQAIIQRGR